MFLKYLEHPGRYSRQKALVVSQFSKRGQKVIRVRDLGGAQSTALSTTPTDCAVLELPSECVNIVIIFNGSVP